MHVLLTAGAEGVRRAEVVEAVAGRGDVVPVAPPQRRDVVGGGRQREVGVEPDYFENISNYLTRQRASGRV